MWKPDVCIFHSPCDDGFASAWVARRKWPDIVLQPTNYGLAFPGLDYQGKNILIADFSYKPDAISELMMSFGARSVVMLDHHKTAEADLKEFKVGMAPAQKFSFDRIDTMLRDMAEFNRPAVLAHFDMEHSGAALTWQFCFPDWPMPDLIAAIEDRDLWRFAIPATRAISLYLKSHPYEFAVWDRLIAEGAIAAAERGLEIQRFYDRQIADIVPTATLKSIGKWKDVPTAHAPYAFAGDLAHELLKAHPTAPFAAVIVDAYGGRTYSLRSEDSRQDVSEVAKMFGGGGHRNAAGFRVPV